MHKKSQNLEFHIQRLHILLCNVKCIYLLLTILQSSKFVLLLSSLLFKSLLLLTIKEQIRYRGHISSHKGHQVLGLNTIFPWPDGLL